MKPFAKEIQFPPVSINLYQKHSRTHIENQKLNHIHAVGDQRYSAVTLISNVHLTGRMHSFQDHTGYFYFSANVR